MRADLLSIAEANALPTTLGADPTLLHAELMYVIRDAIVNTPRTLQKRIGPSGLGHPCDRRIAHELMQHDPVNPRDDANWRATVGQAIHAWLDDTFTKHNDQLGVPRWICEQRVMVGAVNGEDIDGHTDMFDLATRTVIDWKTTSVDKIKAYKKKGPGASYEQQAHLYGQGWLNKGIDHVGHVAIVFLPREGELAQGWTWTDTFDPAKAAATLARSNVIGQATQLLGDLAPGLMNIANEYCSYCPFYKRGATDLTTSCPGHPEATTYGG